MKKLLSIFLAMLMLSVICVPAFAAENDTSKTAAEEQWWEWFNSLSQEEQACINFRPSNAAKTADNSLPAETESWQAEEPFALAASLLPTGGGEPVYNYSYWEQNKLYANCYIYAMDVITSTVGGANPGHYGGGEITAETLSKSNVASLIYTAIENDGPYLGNGRSIRTATKNTTPGSDEYKIAIVVAPGQDYHFYVQNSDGYWSHKPGTSSCTRYDASGNLITDPQAANRNYSYANYSTFCGYYIMKRL